MSAIADVEKFLRYWTERDIARWQFKEGAWGTLTAAELYEVVRLAKLAETLAETARETILCRGGQRPTKGDYLQSPECLAFDIARPIDQLTLLLEEARAQRDAAESRCAAARSHSTALSAKLAQIALLVEPDKK